MLEQAEIQRILEAALLASPDPLSLQRMLRLFNPGDLPEGNPRQAVKSALADIEYGLDGHGYRLRQVASGYRFQVHQSLSPWVSRLFEEKPPRYSRALLETLALIAYRQPATRGDIEQVRGVAVSPNIMRTLLERGWIRAVGQKEVPGRPSLYGTTNAFLDYFDLKSLDELPPMSEIRALIATNLGQADEQSGDAVDSDTGDGSTWDATQGAVLADGEQGEEAQEGQEGAAKEEDSALANVVPLPTLDR